MPGDPPEATRAHPPRPRRPHDPDRTRPPAAPVPADPPRVGRRARGRAGARRRRDLLRVPDPHRLRGVGRGRRRAAPPCRPRARVRRADDRLATPPGPTLGPHPQLGRGVRGRRGQRAPGGRGPRRLGRGARTTPSRHPAGGVDRPDRARRRRGPDVPQRGERRPGRRRTGVPGGLRDLGDVEHRVALPPPRRGRRPPHPAAGAGARGRRPRCRVGAARPRRPDPPAAG